jgi:hypothetical protein
VRCFRGGACRATVDARPRSELRAPVPSRASGDDLVRDAAILCAVVYRRSTGRFRGAGCVWVRLGSRDALSSASAVLGTQLDADAVEGAWLSGRSAFGGVGTHLDALRACVVCASRSPSSAPLGGRGVGTHPRPSADGTPDRPGLKGAGVGIGV